MIIHYLKIAVRNLWKYRTQSVISMLGLAIGFACVPLLVRPWPGMSIDGTPLPDGTTLTTISPEGLDIFGIGWRVWKAVN